MVTGAPDGPDDGGSVEQEREPFDALFLLALLCGVGLVALIVLYTAAGGAPPAALLAHAPKRPGPPGHAAPLGPAGGGPSAATGGIAGGAIPAGGTSVGLSPASVRR